MLHYVPASGGLNQTQQDGAEEPHGCVPNGNGGNWNDWCRRDKTRERMGYYIEETG